MISVFGHGGGKRYNHATSDLEAWKEAMGLPWATKRRSVTEAIPPEYTEYIYNHLPIPVEIGYSIPLTKTESYAIIG